MSGRPTQYRPRYSAPSIRVETAFEVEDVKAAVDMINRKTLLRNAQGKEEERYRSERKRVTLPSQYDEWLKKEIP